VEWTGTGGAAGAREKGIAGNPVAAMGLRQIRVFFSKEFLFVVANVAIIHKKKM
jgi:hypothetical protein